MSEIKSTPNFLYSDVLSEIFSYLEPDELARMSRICRHWKYISDNHSNWFKHLKKIAIQDKNIKTANEAKNSYAKYSMSSFFMNKQLCIINDQKNGAINGIKVPLFSNFFKKSNEDIFKEALLKGDANTVHCMVVNNLVKVNRGLNQVRLFSLFRECDNILPLHIAVLKEHENLVFQLLLLGADITEKFRLNSFTLPKHVFEITSNNKIKSMLYLAFAELYFNGAYTAKKDGSCGDPDPTIGAMFRTYNYRECLEIAERYFKRGYFYNAGLVQAYVEKISCTFKGYRTKFDEKELVLVNEWNQKMNTQCNRTYSQC